MFLPSAASLAALLVATSLPAADSPAAGPPNVVLFVSDDHGWYDGPVFGSRAVRTPNLERIAAEGTAFANAFVGSPACVPSRAVFMTGLMSARNGAEANHSRIRPGLKTLPTYLKELGYTVAHFGKSHFQPPAAYPDMEFVPSNTKNGPLTSDLQTEVVEKWLADRKPGGPVCLVVGCHSPHVYWEPNDGYDPAEVELPPTFVDTPETRDYRARYYTDVTKMDRQLGEVYAGVRRRLPENTLFLYFADNGAQWPFAKWDLYDAGIKTPLVAAWPGVLKPGTRSDALVSMADLVPTLVELAGGTPPPDLDGRSFAKLLRGETDRHRDEVYATHSADGDKNVYPIRCVRTERFKYILNLHPEYEHTTHIDLGENRDGLKFWASWERAAATDPRAAEAVRRYHVRPREELYDVQADPHETTNLADRPEHQGELERLREKLQAWMKEQRDAGKTFGTPRLLK